MARKYGRGGETPALGALVCDMRIQTRPPSPGEAMAILAGRQHGVVARGQLLAEGLSRDAIGRRLRAGRLHPLHRGVYAVGHGHVSTEGRWGARVLACGVGAILSHRAAAALCGLRPSWRHWVEVSAARSAHP